VLACEIRPIGEKLGLGYARGANRRGKRVKRSKERAKDSKEEFFYMRKEIYRQSIWELYVAIGFDMKRERGRESLYVQRM